MDETVKLELTMKLNPPNEYTVEMLISQDEILAGDVDKVIDRILKPALIVLFTAADPGGVERRIKADLAAIGVSDARL